MHFFFHHFESGKICFEKLTLLRFYNNGNNNNFLKFYQIFLSPRSAIISNKHGVCELPQELLNDSRLIILRN